MTELLIRMLAAVTLGLVLVLLLRRPARRAFGAGAAFTLWLLPLVLALAPALPEQIAPRAMITVPGLTVTPHAATTVAHAASIDWAHWLLAIWFVGIAIGLLRLVLHYRSLLRGMRCAPDAWTCVLADMPNIDTRRVRVHEAGPAVLWALPRSLILLPNDFAQRFDNAATRGLVLRHEFTHVRRGDAWWSLAMEIASALLWFHPLAWPSRARFRLDQELACDAASLRALPERTAGYAHALLDSVAVQPVPTLIPWLAEPQLKERLAMITHIPPGALHRRAGFLAIAGLLAGGLFVAGGQSPARAAMQTRSHSAAPSVDITSKDSHPPHYPKEAIKKGEQGSVILDVTVDATGKVVGVRVDQNGTDAPADLQEVAIAAAQQWKFNPGRKGGKPVGGVLRIPVNFALSETNANTAKPCPTGDVFDVATSRCTAAGASSASVR